MGSSLIGVSLPGTSTAGRWKNLGLLGFLLIRTPSLLGQAAAPGPGAPELPRFTLRQIILGRNDSVVKIPGPWVRAAAAALPESMIVRSYRAAASRSGLEPLPESTLTAQRSQHVLGLYRRSELLRAAHQTLQSIRSAIPSEATRARFDRVFRPRGEWVVDLHDAALTWARHRVPGLTLGSAGPALRGSHWLEADESPAEESIHRALYGMAVLAANDSAKFAAARADLLRADSASAGATLALLSGYAEGQRWYTDALEFFLREPWIPDGPGRSIQDQMRAEWRDVFGSEAQPPLPVIETRWFGYPQAVPQYGIPTSLFAHLIAIENSAAEEWLRENGEPGLLRTLRWLPEGDTTPTMLRAGSQSFRLTTVSRQARESLNGFLEPRDLIAIDPGYSPLLALGTILHEWQHLLFRRRQLEIFARSLTGADLSMVHLPRVQPHLAEGFAEWSAERVMTPVTRRWPLLGLGELEKRADLILRDTDDQHTIGYGLVRTLAAAVRNPASTTDLLLRHAEQPSGILSEPAVRKAWSRYGGSADRTLRMPQHRLLVPEVTFTIEAGFPDVIAMRILVPGPDDARP